jgi:hypothetical protein
MFCHVTAVSVFYYPLATTGYSGFASLERSKEMD